MATQQFSEEFIGRARELEIFTSWLDRTGGPEVLYFYDAPDEAEKKGGIGKTFLLRRCFSLVKQQYPLIVPVAIDFFDVKERDGITVAEHVVYALQQRFREWRAESFHRSLAEYNAAVSSAREDTQGLRERLGDALTSDLYLLRQQMSEMNAYLLLFFDTFEAIERNPVIAVLRTARPFPDMYHFDRIRAVIAGRNQPDWSHQNWTGRQDEVQVVALSPFNEEETIRYLESRIDDLKDESPETLQTIYKLTEGRPILLGLVTDVVNDLLMIDPASRHNTKLASLIVPKSQFEERLIADINNFDQSRQKAIFCMAHIYHRFNPILLDLISNTLGMEAFVPTVAYQDLIATLRDLTFVRQASSGEDFVLHDEMRRLVNKYSVEIQDPGGRMRSDLSEIAIKFYQQQIQAVQSEQEKQSYIVEMLYHVLFRDSVLHKNVDQGLAFLNEHFTRAINLSQRTFGRNLLQEAQKFESFMSSEQRGQLKLATARLLRVEENPRAALQLYEALESQNSWTTAEYLELLFERGMCYRITNRLDDAIESFQACLKIESVLKTDQPTYARILGQLGYSYRLKGDYPQARRYYEHGLTILRNLDSPVEYADILNSMGNLCRLEGKDEEALRYCKLGWHIRHTLFEQGKLSELYVGLSLSTLAHIYKARDEVAEARHSYQEALEIYERLGYKSGIAGTYNNLGQLLLVEGNLDEAQHYFEQAYRIAQDVDLEGCINSLNRQGQVSVRRGQLDKAIRYFQSARELAQRIKSADHEAENLLALVTVLAQMGQPVTQEIQEVKRISSKGRYYDLLGQAEELQGNSDYKEARYRAAFKHYRATARYLAYFNHLQFEKFLRRLFDLLIEIPNNLLPGVIDSLLEYWYDFHLDKSHPELIDLCKEVRKHMIL
jgi:tetratricopeptide (TPR) repeat protein